MEIFLFLINVICFGNKFVLQKFQIPNPKSQTNSNSQNFKIQNIKVSCLLGICFSSLLLIKVQYALIALRKYVLSFNHLNFGFVWDLGFVFLDFKCGNVVDNILSLKEIREISLWN